LTAPLDIRSARLRNQRLSGARFDTPEEVVSWLGAVQAQEYGDSQWGLALRMRGATQHAIEQACAEGRILRTHVLRPTWHFVAPADIRWMLALTGPNVSRRMAPYNRKLGLDADTFGKSRDVIARVLRDGTSLTRQELRAALERSGIATGGVQRLAHLVMQAELDGVICSGPRRGRHATYTLLDERAPQLPALSRDEALAELTRRYFASHGPAQLQDFVWWSGLTVGDARKGLALLGGELTRREAGDATYWSGSPARPRQAQPQTYLLPIYDEYLIAYKDRRAAFDQSRWTQTGYADPFSAPILAHGVVVGTWRRRFTAGTVIVTVSCYTRPSSAARAAIDGAARAYATFIGADLELSS
jgi:hypothetical protein